MITSAIDASITFTLAKINHENITDSSPTLLFLNIREGNKLNNMKITSLNYKLVTKLLPTAEIVLNGTIAEIAPPREQGIP